MKMSPIVASFADANKYSELKVLSSAAGYYVGTTYLEDDGYSVPGTRDSQEYFRTMSEAQTALDNDSFTQRSHS